MHTLHHWTVNNLIVCELFKFVLMIECCHVDITQLITSLISSGSCFNLRWQTWPEATYLIGLLRELDLLVLPE